MTKSNHPKPVGIDGSLRHSVGPDHDERTFNRHVSPKAKDLIEADIGSAFARLVSDGLAGATTLRQLPENDLDFEWTYCGRTAKLELTELVLATPPYRETGQSAVIYCKHWGERFCELVARKNAKLYRENVPIDLLIYSTHFAYHGNSFCVDLAAERLRHTKGGGHFDRVYYLEFRGVVSSLYNLKPYRAALSANLRREYESLWYSTVNFEAGTPVPGGTRFDLDLPGQPDR